ncbi:hypothetical protein L7F22_022135 [Adiantum nelumboides]|nr:hypothetical protein [Adiantum nelumboides]
MQLVAAQVPPPPPPKTSAPPSIDFSVSTKCSSILDANKKQIVKLGETLNLIFAPMVMSCEGIICTRVYKAACDPQGCPLCKYFAGPVNRFQAQIENVLGENIGSSCDVKRTSRMYLISCAAKVSSANLTASYVLKVYAKQLNGSASLLNKTTIVVFQAGDISIQNSGPGYWPNGNEFGVGELSRFMFPVKDNYSNVKNKTTGAASEAEIKHAFGQLPENSTSYLTKFSLNYNEESGYVNATFLPIRLGTWILSLGQPSLGYILGSPYMFEVVMSGISKLASS